LDNVSTNLASEVTEAVQDALDEFAADMERERVDAARRPLQPPPHRLLGLRNDLGLLAEEYESSTSGS
jgi:hypothetical protein